MANPIQPGHFGVSNVFGSNKEISMKDLAKCTGKNNNFIARSYNQIKTFFSSGGVVVNDTRIKEILRTMDAPKMEEISAIFCEATKNSGQYESKSVLKVATIFSKYDGVHLGAIAATTENITKLMKTAKVGAAVESLRMLDPRDLLKSVALQQAKLNNPNFKGEGIAKDFITYLTNEDKWLSDQTIDGHYLEFIKTVANEQDPDRLNAIGQYPKDIGVKNFFEHELLSSYEFLDKDDPFATITGLNVLEIANITNLQGSICQSGGIYLDATYNDARPENNCDYAFVDPEKGIGIVMDGAGHNSAYIAKIDLPVKQALKNVFEGIVCDKDYQTKPDKDKKIILRKALADEGNTLKDTTTAQRRDDANKIQNEIEGGKLTINSIEIFSDLHSSKLEKWREHLNADIDNKEPDRDLKLEVLDLISNTKIDELNKLITDQINGPITISFLKEIMTTSGTYELPAYLMIKIDKDANGETCTVTVAQNDDCCFGMIYPDGRFIWQPRSKDMFPPSVYILHDIPKGTLIVAMSDGTTEFTEVKVIEEAMQENTKKPESIFPALKDAVINPKGSNDGQTMYMAARSDNPKKSDEVKKYDPTDPNKHDDLGGFFLVV